LSLEKLISKVTIKGNREGAILIGKYVACDGADVERPISIISHAHGDHVKQFESALSFCSAVLLTKETKDLLVASRGDYLLKRRNLIELAFEEVYEHNGNSITLYPATHMLGSCQVLLVNGDGDRIVYTGDFNYPNTPVLKTDVLVMEATYGTPDATRTTDQDALARQFVSIVRKEIQKQKRVFVLAHPGKIQYLMNRLRSANVNVPFLAHKKDVQWAEVYRKHGLDVGTVCETRTPKALHIQKSKDPYVSFHRFGSVIPEADKHVRIRVSRFRAVEEIYQPSENYYVIALSDHADFRGLLEYVEKSKAKLVITDASRCDRASELAEQIKSKLEVEAIALPP